ncbi:hypothetical protein D3C84_214100 [compost metagenome]
MSIGQVQQAQELRALVIGRDLTRLPQAEFTHQGLRQLLAGDRGDPGPVRHGAFPRPYRQDQGQGPFRRQAPLLLPAQPHQPLLLQLVQPISQRQPGGVLGMQRLLQIAGTGGALQLQLAEQGMAIRREGEG